MSDSEDYSEPDAIIIGRDDVSNYNPDNILPKTTDEIERIREWLEPTLYAIAGGEYRKHLASHAPGTGQWLASTDEYRQWLHGDECGLLWIKGIPGSGKSVHVAKLITDLAEENPGCPVLFFFSRQIIAANHSPQALFRDWMDQVLQYSPPLQNQLWTYIKDGVSLGSFSTADLLKDLQVAFRGLPDRIFCKPAKVKVLISSRPVPSVENPLYQTPAWHIRLEERLVDIDISTYVNSALSGSHIPPSEWGVIANAVPGRANGLFLYAKLAIERFLEPGADVKTVLAQLPKDLNVLYTELLQEHARRSGISTSLQHLILQSVTHATKPLRLLELAEMCRVVDPVGTDRDLRAMKAFIRTACRPLLEILPDDTVSVVHHSFTEYLKGTTRSDHESGYPVLRPGPAHGQLALSCLRYLLETRCLDEVEITIDDGDTTAAFGDEHYDGSRGKWTPESIIKLRLKFPFFMYATRNWHAHVRNAEDASYEQDEINDMLEKFLRTDTNIKAWLEVCWPGCQTNARMFTALHVAGRYGLASYTRRLVADWAGDVDALDITGKTALWWAAHEGHAAMVKELIAAGANPDHHDGLTGRKPLHEASSRNHHAVVKILLDAGVDPFTPHVIPDQAMFLGWDEPGGKPATAYACEHGHLETVNVLLPHIGLDAMHDCLNWAAECGQARIVTHLLAQPGVEVDATLRGSTPLFRACASRNRDLASVTALLEAGADPEFPNMALGPRLDDFEKNTNIPGGSVARYSCLHALCGLPGKPISSYDWDDEDSYEILELLIKGGADASRQMDDGANALHFAVRVSYYLSRLLMEHGASAQCVDSEGRTPLHYSDAPACIPLLVDEGGANIDARDIYGNTPLLHALANDNMKHKVPFLLKCGADARVVNSDGDSTLHVALSKHSGTLEIAQALLDGGVEPDKRNRKGETALMLSSRSEDAEKIWDMLLSAGANINAKDQNGCSVFWHETRRISNVRLEAEDSDRVKFLLNHGALPDLRDNRGMTCLHEAIKTQAVDSPSNDAKDTPGFDFMLSLGVDPTVTDHDGNTLLHELAAIEGITGTWGRKAIFPLWKRLVDTLGLDVDQQNDPEPIDLLIERMKNLNVKDHTGATALHIASTRTEYCTRKLLDAHVDVRATTHDHLTPLHLAVRAQESNIVGMLVQSLYRASRKSRSDPGASLSNDSGHRGGVAGIDDQDSKGLTPLYYAIRSGRPETVLILLVAGANLYSGGCVFKACGEFEEELARHDAMKRTKLDPLTLREAIPDGQDIYHAYLPRKKQPSIEISVGDSRRLEEIVAMLIDYGANTSVLASSKGSTHRGVLSDCVWQGKAYTASCLLNQVPRSLWVEEGKSTPYEGFLAVSAPAYDPSLAESDDFPQFQDGKTNAPVFSLFLRQRQYHLVKELAKRGTRFLPKPRDGRHPSHLGVLVQHGFTLLFNEIGKIEAGRALEQGNWHAFGDSSKVGLWCANRPENESDSEGRVEHHYESDEEHIPKPFLLEAVQRELPNLGIVRSLVEDFHVDVNERTWDSKYADGAWRLVYGESALHFVAQGLHWWHVHHALKYLLKQPGIDINLLVKGDVTPLHVAIGCNNAYSQPRPHAYDSAKRLLKAGANIHAITGRGQSCVSLAVRDVRMLRLLVKRGAIVSPDDVIAAVEAGRIDVLQELLKVMDNGYIQLDLDPALHAAGMIFRKPEYGDGYWSPSIDDDIIIEMIRILIDRGANPLSNFFFQEEMMDDLFRPKRERMHFKKGSPTLDKDITYSERTLLHDLLTVKNFQLQPFLVPGIDVNHKDPQGQTILHAACASFDNVAMRPFDINESAAEGGPQETVFQRLTVLVSLLDSYSYATPEGRAIMEEMVTLAPELVNEADIHGDTPLAYAVRQAVRTKTGTEAVRQLLSVGAAPLATNKECESVLHILAEELGTAELRELFRELVGRGVDINGRNKSGQTPLFGFARRSPNRSSGMYQEDNCEAPLEQGAIELLKELGANFFAKDNEGRGLLHIAASGDVARFQELVAVGLDPMIENNMQQTAIDIAAATCNDAILEIFEKKARK
ncbi:unnamed protein product [Clonostachys rosea]|uniref:Nephrocystin 3-like N-terminal domain-containing protein n=1 Tax=Bionectria ochroleuca TaxID=29856 RepID=A0ABY6UEK3_BIOOC|nr:unnamed protein product [Clonostachys rosea]